MHNDSKPEVEEVISEDLPQDYDRLAVVYSLKEMFKLMADNPENINIIIYRRGPLSGDFNRLAFMLDELQTQAYKKNNRFDIDKILSQIIEHDEFDTELKAAASTVLNDRSDFYEQMPFRMGMHTRIERTITPAIEEFHEDSPRWRLMSCYNKPGTQWIKNDDVGESFLMHEYRSTISKMIEGAIIYEMQPGDIWAHAGRANKKTEPFYHRGISVSEDHPPRLMTVCDSKNRFWNL